ncbi:MAG TPA: FixH family protein [Gemmataceae bacterium]|nr:FixH family protein [Gemmataceae bacterium]
MNARSLLRVLVLAAVLLHPHGMLHADGGTVRLSQRKGDYRITVFTSPTPLRAGPVDISVFVQDLATGEPVPQARITVRTTPRRPDGKTSYYPATTAAATNKLYQAAVFDLAEQGWWDVEIDIEGLREPIAVSFAMEADQPLPRVWEIAPWIAWPALAIVLFCVHQGLVRRKARQGRIKPNNSGNRACPPR